MEMLPGAGKSSHKTNKATNAGERVGAGSRHTMSPPGNSTCIRAYNKGQTHLDTLTA